MASRSAPPCTHELRPGTNVCLRCQHAERAAKRARQHQLIARGAAGTLVLAVIAAIGVAGATAIRARMRAPERPVTGGGSNALIAVAANADTSPSAQPADTAVDPGVAKSNGPGMSTASVPAPTPTPVLAPAPASPNTSPSAATVAKSAGAAVAPLVPVGRTPLRDTMVADRAGDTVRVSFDLMLSRTRRSDKFEAIIRSTLPQVYGAPADSALRALPAGAVARAGDLMTTLPQSGFRIPLADGSAIAVWPETRAGRDGPLVVAYRAVASR